ncbi:MAG: HAMP domain-containing protein [Phycisphaerales bacterium]|nr:HAMP domain-containing protein [Phycisphaerales bacterium]
MSAQLVIALALGFYTYIHARQFHYDQTQGELQRMASVLVARFSDELGKADGSRIDRIAKEEGRRTDTRITIILPDGKVIADSETDPAGMENHRYGRPEIEAALSSGKGSAVRYSNTLGESMMYFAEVVVTEDGTLAIVRTALPLTRIDDELGRIIRVVAIAGLLSLLAAFVVIYLVSRRISRQLSQLAAGAGRFAGGDLEHRIVQPTATELSSLAEALNDMARQLSDRINDLQAQQREQRAILQSMSNGIIAIDADQRIIIMNRAAEGILRSNAESAKGRLLQEVAREPELHRFVAGVLAGNHIGPSELQLGAERSIIVQACSEMLVSADGRQTGLLVILDEVTQLRRLESLRSDFAANVSHELRTPITNIKGYVETLLDVGWDDRDQAERFLEIIKSNSSRLAAIVEDVMALTELEQPHAKEAMERERVILADLLEGAAGQFESAASDKGISLVVKAQSEGTAVIHHQLIEQAVANLLSNAVRYSPPGTTVTARAEVTYDAVILSVEDDGPGIPAEHIPRLFERFYRVDKARSRELGGTGLGLAIVKYITLMHGGHVDVSSEVGCGSTFRIILPTD